jgi:hypothetical protein
MKRFFAIIAAVFIAALSFALPITARAYDVNTYDFNNNGTSPFSDYIQYSSDYTNRLVIGDNWLYVNFGSTRTNPNGTTPAGTAFFTWNDSDVNVSYDDSTGYFLISSISNDTSVKPISYYIESGYFRSNSAPTVHDIDKLTGTEHHIYFNPSTGDIYFTSALQNSLSTRFHGIWNYSGYDLIYYEGQSYGSAFDTSAHVNLSFTFAPTMSGTVSRQQTINGHNYTSDTLDLTVTNNGDNAQWALFIVPHGENITIPALQWDNSKIWTGPSIFTFVRDEWCFDHFEPVGDFDVDTTQLMPSALHYIASYSSKSYNINWNSMKLSANTSYDLVCYAALNDRGDNAVSFSNTYTYEEVYRSAFTITDPATYNPDNTGDNGYSWDNDNDNSGLLSMRKASQDSFGNFYVNYPNNSYTNNKISASVNSQQAFGNYFNFITTILSFFPAPYLSLILIGISAMVVIGIIKVVTH